MTLNTKAWLGLAALAVTMSLMLFGAAGTFTYWQAWVFLLVFLGASLVQTLYLMKHDPALLRRRLRGGPTAEKEPRQRIIMAFNAIGFVAFLVVSALDHRFGWSTVSTALVIAGDLLIAVGYYVIFLVFKANPFTSATVEIAEGQQVVTTGPYARVRHPMYAGAFLYCLGIPLALGSYWGFLPLAAMTPFLLWRLLDEERFLTRNLPGYAEYRQEVRYRLLPGIL